MFLKKLFLIKSIIFIKQKLTKPVFLEDAFLILKWQEKIKYNTALKDIYIGSNPGDAGGAVGSIIFIK